MAKNDWNGDRFLSITAMFISILTLLVFIYQTNLIRKQQFMSVYPYMGLGHIGLESPKYRLVLSNEGIGPAIIHSVQLKYDDKVLDEPLRDYLGARINQDSFNFYYSDVYPGRLIPAGDHIELIGVGDRQLGTFYQLNTLLSDEKLEYEIVYESIYGERWKIWLEGSAPLKLN